MITALLATHIGRKDTVRTAINSIYDQVDRIRIVFNEYGQVPKWAADDPKIISTISKTGVYEARAVWLYGESPSGYVFVIDDDILYPDDYVGRMIDVIEKYSRCAVVVSHGAILRKPYIRYAESAVLSHFSYECPKNMRVHTAGVGTLAFHTDTITLEMKDFPLPLLRDIQFSVLCAEKRIGIICIQRPKGWLSPIPTNDVPICNRTNQPLKEKIIKQRLIPLLWV